MSQSAIYQSSWKSPSNIALVKYWGKRQPQLPENSSISFTLSECYTASTLKLFEKKEAQSSIEVYLDGETKPDFIGKFQKLLGHATPSFHWVNDFDFRLDTKNTFPHSSGIASSASGMSALALILCDLHQQISQQPLEQFFRNASILSRLGSGSAARSVYGGLVVWGQHPLIAGSHQEYAIPYPYEVHPIFENFCDTILLVHQGSKSVSSTAGHQLMEKHAFAQARYHEAEKNMERLMPILKSGDLDAFISLVESEALMLHGLMMSSIPYFILMKANTLKIIENIWDYRKQNQVPVFFTLDAGANVHLLYPNSIQAQIENWVQNELSQYCENKQYICDRVGKGPEKLFHD